MSILIKEPSQPYARLHVFFFIQKFQNILHCCFFLKVPVIAKTVDLELNSLNFNS